MLQTRRLHKESSVNQWELEGLEVKQERMGFGGRNRQLPYSRETSGRNGLRHRAGTVVSQSLDSSQLDDNLAAEPECVVEIEVTSGSSRLAVDNDILDICGCPDRNGLLHRFNVVVLDSDCGTGIHIAVVNGILWDKGR